MKKSFLILLMTFAVILANSQDFRRILTDTTLIKKDLWKKERLSYYLNANEIHNDDFASFYNRGLKKMHDSLFQEAIKDFKKSNIEDKYYTENIPELNKNQLTVKILENIAICHYFLEDDDSALYYYQKIIEINPYYEPAYLGIFSICYERGDTESAIEVLNESVEIMPGSPELLYNLGIAYIQNNQKNKAKRIGKELIKRFPEYGRSYILLGAIYLLEGKYNYAINTFTQSIEINPDFPLAYFLRGSMYISEEDYLEAYEDLRKYYTYDTLNERVNTILGFLDIKFSDSPNKFERLFTFMRADFIAATERKITNPRSLESDYIWRQLISGAIDPEELEFVESFIYEILWGNRLRAKQLLNDYISAFPKSLFAKRFLAAMYVDHQMNDGFENDHRENITRIDRLIESAPDTAMFRFLKGHAEKFDNENEQESIDAYKHGIELYPDYAFAYCQIGDLYYFQNKFDSAIDYYSRAIKRFPDYHDAYYGRAKSLDAMPDKYQQAVEDYKYALTIETGLSTKTIEINIASCYADIGQYDSAVVYLNKILDYSPGDLSQLEKRGYAYLQLGNYDPAINDYTNAINIYEAETYKNPQRARSYFERGNCYFYNKMYNKAIDDYQSALAIYPDNATVLGALGDCYRNSGDCENALKYYDKAIELNPDNKWYPFKKAFCFNDNNQYLEGIMSFLNATKIDSTFSEAYEHIGYNYLKLGRYTQCIAFSQKALKYDQTSYSAAYNIAFAFLKLGNFDKSYQIYANTKSVTDEMNKINYDIYINLLKDLMTDEKFKDQAKKILIEVFKITL